MGKFQDLSGMKFGKLKVIEKDLKKSTKKSIYWICECECGNTKSILGGNLRSGKSTSCGCGVLKATKNRHDRFRENNIGKRFGKLVILSYDEYGSNECGRTKYICKCDCGNVVSVRWDNINNGDTTSCGCYGSEYSKERKQIDLTNKKFGKLVAIKRLDNGKWLCNCECGGTTEVTTAKLTTGHTVSCGCVSSKGELSIRKYLDKINIPYEQQKEFNNLIGVGEKKLSYDFYIPNKNILIEYQGQFHDGTARIQDEEQFKIQQEHDKRKREYAKKHNIELLEIWYYDYENIEKILENKFNLKERLNNE